MSVTVVRRAETGDLQDVAALRWRWRIEEGGEHHDDRARWTADFVAWLSEHVESHRCFVVVHGGSIVGAGWLAVVDRIPTVDPSPGEVLGLRRSGYLQGLYVLPEHRNSGCGDGLVRALVDDARAIGLAYVSVHPSERSFSLYRRHGFVETDRVLQLRF